MLGLAHLENAEREAMPRRVLLWNGVPAAVLDGNACLLAGRFEPDFDVG